jgi:lysozyme
MARRINAEGLALLRQWEGCRLDAYRDIGGVWTIGYGHTRTARQGMTITQEQAEALLREDLRVFETAIADAVDVDLSDNQFAALVSWAYNVGVSAMRRSSLVRRLNAGDYDAVPTELAKWNRVKGQVVRGLSNRRAAEAGLWARGAFVASRNIAPTDGGLSAKEAATRTGTGKAAVTVGTAGVVSTIAQHSDAISALGFVGPVIGVALVVAAAVLFVLWRRGHI